MFGTRDVPEPCPVILYVIAADDIKLPSGNLQGAKFLIQYDGVTVFDECESPSLRIEDKVIGVAMPADGASVSFQGFASCDFQNSALLYSGQFTSDASHFESANGGSEACPDSRRSLVLDFDP